MKVGLVAMSGVRCVDQELLELGLNLPGFVERSRVIASLPSLSLLSLAPLTPDGVEVEYREVAELADLEELPRDWDLAAISTFSAQAFEAYALADRFRAAATPVVFGGLHASAVPDEAAQHADAVIIGEGEPVWAQVVEDARRGELRPVYCAEHVWNLADSPVPAYELLELERYNRLTVQTSRGCPHRCEFCASSPQLGAAYRVKPVERVLAEIDRIRELWPDPFLELADDNSFVSKRQARLLVQALRGRGLKWFCETDVAIADDEELLAGMRETGCRQVLVGLESPSAEALRGIELRNDWKLQQRDRYERAIATIQGHGITVNGCFVLGLDGDDAGVFERVAEFVEQTGLFEVQITVLTPFPGTPLYARLLAEDRLLKPGAWDRCTLFDINYRPRQMTPERLRAGLMELGTALYCAENTKRRRRRFFEAMRASGRPHELEQAA